MKEHYLVIGYPLTHTMSPFIHTELFALSRRQADYSVMEISPADLKQGYSALKDLNGFNITIPHKQTIIPFLDRVDDSAQLYGAVNTVAIKNGVSTGYNTDGFGFKKALSVSGIMLEGSVLICGAGGAARTIAYESAMAGCEITLAVKESTLPKATLLADEIRERFSSTVSVLALDDIHGSFTLAVNATPLGMYPHMDASPLTAQTLKKCSAVFDAVYNPEKTKLLVAAEELGLKTAYGMPMLVWQAAAAHMHWYGAEFSTEDIIQLTDKANCEMRRIFN